LETDPKALELFIENLSGLSAADTRRLARKAIFDDGALLRSDIPDIMRAKYELLNRHGILRYEHDTAAFSEVGGLGNFKAWLEPRRAAFDGSAPQLDPPKGVLLLGANAHRTQASAQSILTEIKTTRPLSILMAEKVSALRRWAAERAVPAG
jgi:hypothetical protein